MTNEGNQTFKLGSSEITIPGMPQCCFTELKLSASRRHAKSYGRLGIGVKRPFLFERFGRPVAYFGYGVSNHRDKFLEACARDLQDKRQLNFFKPMNSNSHYLSYDLYAESEWRFILQEDLLRSKLIKDPRDTNNKAEHAYFNSLKPDQRERLKYLVPLDSWFAMIIYPSGMVKNAVTWGDDGLIEDQISRIKTNPYDRANRVEGQLRKKGLWPIELELDACRNF